MDISKKQRKYIRKNLGRFSISEIANNLEIDEKELFEYCKKNYPNNNLSKQEGGNNTNNKGFLSFILSNWKQLLFLTILTIIVYTNSLTGDFLSDDIAGIRNNPTINDSQFFFSSPVFFNFPALLTFLTHKIFGFNTFYYHLTNVLFHLGSGFLVYAICLLYFFPNSVISLFAASLFIVHPLQTEAVTWISGRPYSISAFFALLSFFCYLLSKKLKVFYFISLISFYIALMGLEKLVFLPFLFVFYEIFFGSFKKNIVKFIPFFIISGLYGLRLVGLAGVRTAALEASYYQQPGYDNLFLKIPLAVTSYLELIFFPKDLTLYHSNLLSYEEYVIRAVVFIFLLIGAFFIFKKEKKGFFWIIFFLIPLLPTLTPLRVGWVVAERYVYLSALGIYIIAAFFIFKIGAKSNNKNISWIIFILILVVLSLRTITRNSDWKDADTLWVSMAKSSPYSPQNHNNLGDVYYKRGDYDRAILEFQTAIKLNPRYGDAFHNLANVYLLTGKQDLAIENYQKAISINPKIWETHQNLAHIYFSQKKYEFALDSLNKAIELNPTSYDLYYNLGVVYLSLGKKQEAKEALNKSAVLNPSDNKAKQLLQQIK